MLVLGSEVPYCTGEELPGSQAGQAASRADRSLRPYGTNLGSAGNYSSDVPREEAGVPGLLGLFAASREAACPWVWERGKNGFRKRSSIPEDDCRVRGVDVNPLPALWGCCYQQRSITPRARHLQILPSICRVWLSLMPFSAQFCPS